MAAGRKSECSIFQATRRPRTQRQRGGDLTCPQAASSCMSTECSYRYSPLIVNRSIVDAFYLAFPMPAWPTHFRCIGRVCNAGAMEPVWQLEETGEGSTLLVGLVRSGARQIQAGRAETRDGVRRDGGFRGHRVRPLSLKTSAGRGGRIRHARVDGEWYRPRRSRIGVGARAR